jgi:DNA-binding NtrC family response regulator
MKELTSALLVHQNSETMRVLSAALERQGVHVKQAGSRAQAKRMLGGLNPAPLVFTDIQLPDGTWADILAMGEKVAQPVNVIVVARVVDTRFYVEVIEAGAFDFIAPPFNASDLAHVIRCALDNAIARRTHRLGPGRVVEEDAYSEVRHESGTPLATS